MAKPHVFNFFAPVNDNTISIITGQISESMNYQNDNRAESILIKLSSGGGNLRAGFTFYNFIRSIHEMIPITIVNFANVDSVAVIMYLASDRRLMVPHSEFLLHDFDWTFNAGSVNHSRLAEHVASLDADVVRYSDIFNERTNGAERAINISEHLHGSPLIVDATTAIASGIAQEVVEPERVEIEDAIRWWINL